jgi:hypothetical protein
MRYLVLILPNEIRIQDGECCGDAEQANKPNNLPHYLGHEEHEHDACTTCHCERHHGHEMGVIPHTCVSKGPKVVDTNHVVLLHMPEHNG